MPLVLSVGHNPLGLTRHLQKWLFQAHSLWFMSDCRLTPPKACITLNTKTPCYQMLLSGVTGSFGPELLA